MIFSAETFIDLWKNYLSHKKLVGPLSTEIVEKFKNDSEWTNWFFGSAQRSAKDSPLGNYVKENHGLEYRTEEFKIDLVFSNGQRINHLADLKSEDSIDMTNRYYPIIYDIIIEHENNIENCWDEMFKLTRFRSRLKVLVTYHPFKSNRDKEMDILVNNFSNIIKSCNQTFAINHEEYLLINGQRLQDDKENLLIWKYAAFNENGITDYK